jgi:uncharacterized protein (TIGR02145 family)
MKWDKIDLFKKKYMMRIRIIIAACFLFWYLGLSSQEKLEIEGAITIGNAEETSPKPGTIRWTGTDLKGWNGTKWISLTTGIAFAREVTDIDGHVYPTIIIGTQEWMAENLRTSKYQDGSVIPLVTNNTSWSSLNNGAYCWYDNDNKYEHPYGKLYNWYTVEDSKGLCPSGWHVPSHAEWTTLTDFLGGLGTAGGLMKEGGSAHWDFPNTKATNASGFTGLPGGLRYTGGSFGSLGTYGYWWSSIEVDSDAWYRVLDHITGECSSQKNDKTFGFSVRCVHD